VPYTRWQLRLVGLGRRDRPVGTATQYQLWTSVHEWLRL